MGMIFRTLAELTPLTSDAQPEPEPEDCCEVAGGDGSTCDGACGPCNDDASCLDACGVANGDSSTCDDCCGVPNGSGDSCDGACGPCNDDISCEEPEPQPEEEEDEDYVNEYGHLNVFGEPLQRCSHTGMALTGFTRSGSCEDVEDDVGTHHICIDLSSTTTEQNFCEVTNQWDWCSSEMECDGMAGECPVEHWCVCQWAFSSYLANAGGCDYVQDVVCDAINLEAVLAYEASSDPDHAVALACIQERCPGAGSSSGSDPVPEPQPQPQPDPVEECGHCDSSADCTDGHFCCPYQHMCIPYAYDDCLCYNGMSEKQGVIADNNERVASGATDCGGQLCAFCPATAPEVESCGVAPLL